jgi:putative Mg2+ transporter-C (MgtC) family protein
MILQDPPLLEVALRLALAFVFALPIGWERERRSRAANLRTYPLLSVCVGGILLAGLGTGGGPGEQADVYFGVLTGIGFVVSGAIVTSPEHPSGMTTAVSLWTTGAIGASTAYGNVPIAAAL